VSTDVSGELSQRDRLELDVLEVDVLEVTETDEPDEDAGRRLRAALEAVLMVADEPVAAAALARATGEAPDEVDLLLRELAGEYAEQGRGFELREVSGGWRMYSRAEHADVVEAFLLDGQTAKLTQAALETLSIVAYRQPVSRARVSAVRGVGVDGVMRTLLTRGLVTEAGVEATSGATLYRTTGEFLHRMGLASLDDLPPLAPFLPDELSLEDLEPREVLAAPAGEAVAAAAAVGDDGGDGAPADVAPPLAQDTPEVAEPAGEQQDDPLRIDQQQRSDLPGAPVHDSTDQPDDEPEQQ
jgi:segregation and condensation protein B